VAAGGVLEGAKKSTSQNHSTWYCMEYEMLEKRRMMTKFAYLDLIDRPDALSGGVKYGATQVNFQTFQVIGRGWGVLYVGALYWYEVCLENLNFEI
jgi:hypothetical protein